MAKLTTLFDSVNLRRHRRVVYSGHENFARLRRSQGAQFDYLGRLRNWWNGRGI